MQHFSDFFRNAVSVRVASPSGESVQSQAIKYIICIFEATFFIHIAIKSATLLAHAVFARVSSRSRPSEIKNSAVVDKRYHSILTGAEVRTFIH